MCAIKLMSFKSHRLVFDQNPVFCYKVAMQQVLASYKVVIRKDLRTGTDEVCYTAYVPELGIATDGDTIQEAVENSKELIKFQLECLVQEGQEVPIFAETESMVYDARFQILPNKLFKFAY